MDTPSSVTMYRSTTWLHSRLHTTRTISSDISDHSETETRRSSLQVCCLHRGGKTAAADVCHLLIQRLSKFPSSANCIPTLLSPCKQKVCVLPRSDKYNGLQVTSLQQQRVSQQQIRFLSVFLPAWCVLVSHAAHLYSGGLVV